MSEARDEATLILRCVEQARTGQGWNLLSSEEQMAIVTASERLMRAKSSDDSKAMRESISELDGATHRLAELMMDDAVIRAMRGKR